MIPKEQIENEIEEVKEEILKTVLNKARLKTLGFAVNKEGSHEFGNIEQRTKDADYNTEQLALKWLRLSTELTSVKVPK